MERDDVLSLLTTRIRSLALPPSGVLRVGIDGPDAAGKSTLADELAVNLRAAGMTVLQASIDGFHNPRSVRLCCGEDSPLGYYEDSFNLPALRRELLDPAGAGGSRLVTPRLFDYRADCPDRAAPIQLEAGSLLLFDGIFLQRPELKGCFDFTLFVQVGFDTILRRAAVRDVGSLGSPEAVRSRYLNRYLPAQQMYLSRCRPDLCSSAVIINDDPAHPRLLLPDLPE